MTRDEWLKTRWEFLRRDPEYRKAWEEIARLHERMRTAPRDEWTAAAETEFETAERFGLRLMIDPNRGFSEYAKSYNALAKYYSSLNDKLREPTVFSMATETLRHWQDGTRLTISIDLDKVNSIHELKTSVSKTIDKSWKNIERGRKANVTDYEKILEVGDLRAQGKTARQIAALMFPRAFVDPLALDDDDNDPDQDPDTKIDSVEYYLKRFDELVHGGWRRMNYP